ncbi:tRNA-specific adenosine deaminase [compost metagenome]
MNKRTSYITWDEYFMAIAQIVSERSKDPNTRVGSCVINSKNRIVATGYNGMPNNVSDDDISWNRDGELLETKYPYVCHAELNAVLNSTVSLEDCKMYVTLFPCNECAKAIIQSGIKELVYLEDKYPDTDGIKASKKMFDLAGIKYTKYISSGKSITIKV